MLDPMPARPLQGKQNLYIKRRDNVSNSIILLKSLAKNWKTHGSVQTVEIVLYDDDMIAKPSWQPRIITEKGKETQKVKLIQNQCWGSLCSTSQRSLLFQGQGRSPSGLIENQTNEQTNTYRKIHDEQTFTNMIKH